MINADGTKSEPIQLYKLIQSIESAIGTIREEDAKNCDGSPSDETTVDSSVKSLRNKIKLLHYQKLCVLVVLQNHTYCLMPLSLH